MTLPGSTALVSKTPPTSSSYLQDRLVYENNADPSALLFVGQPITLARAFVKRPIDLWRYYAGYCGKLPGEVCRLGDNVSNLQHEILGASLKWRLLCSESQGFLEGALRAFNYIARFLNSIHSLTFVLELPTGC